ncbi:hypothetical protein [Halorussus ruber]|uniref:hypothetical protein n=1 Tax=Halorussus ruber TaxID=1126238 RepID=UPI001092D549|nr:hypothetical protein [Halorussus ruber]
MALLAGCAGFPDSTTTITELEVELANGTDDSHAFHFAVETSDGLSEWESREVAPKTSESVVREPPEEFDPVAVHGVVDDQTARGELRGIDNTEANEMCLHVIFEYGLGDRPTFLQDSDSRC